MIHSQILKMAKNDKKYFIRFWLPVLIYLAFIFVLSSFSAPIFAETTVPFLDKLFHTAEYALLGFLLIRGFKNSRLLLSNAKFILLAVALATLYGISDEFHQYFVPNRGASLADILFDCIGSVIGSTIYRKGK